MSLSQNKTSLSSNSLSRGGSSLSATRAPSSSQPTPEELVLLAKMQGGNVAEIAEELTNPRRSMLSTAGKKFKNTFGQFMDIISTPSQVVAGLISKDYTVREAMDQNLSVSDAIFGAENIFDKDGDPSTLAKIGNFLVRLPTDILLDPTTYLTFGASSGVMGIKALSKVSIGKEAAEQLGSKFSKKAAKDGFTTVSVNKQGQELLDYTRSYQRQMSGDAAIDAIQRKQGGLALQKRKQDLIASGVNKSAIDIAEREAKKFALTKSQDAKVLKTMLKDTIEAPLDIDDAKKVFSNILANNPALTTEFIDKGGIKFFGKTLLSAQRVSKASQMIPFMSKLDNFVEPIRNRALSVFDTSIVKMDDGTFRRIPEEFKSMQTKLKSVGEKMNIDAMKKLSDIQKNFNLNAGEMDILAASLNTLKVPMDPKLAKAYYFFRDINEEQLKNLRATGRLVNDLQGHIGNIFVEQDTKKIRINSGLSKELGASQQQTMAKYVEQSERPLVETNAKLANKILEEGPGALPPQLKQRISTARSVQDIEYEIGKDVDSLVRRYTEQGVPIEEAFQKQDVKKLLDFRAEVETLPRNRELVGKADFAKVKGADERVELTAKKTEEEIRSIMKEADEKLTRLQVKKEIFLDDIAELTDSINQIATGNITKSILKNMPTKDKESLELLSKRIEDFVGKQDIEKLKGAVLNEKNADDVVQKITKSVGNKEDADSIVKKTLKEYENLRLDIDLFNETIREIARKEKKEIVKRGAKEVANKMSPEDINAIAAAYARKSAAKFGIVRENINENALVKVVESLKNEYLQNPTGLRRVINSLLGKESKLADVIAEIDETNFLARKQIEALPEFDTYFTDNANKIYKRVASTAKELAEEGFVGFDTNIITSTLTRSLQNNRQALGQFFAEGLVRNFSKLKSEAPEGWVSLQSAITDDKIAKQFGDIVSSSDDVVFHPAIAKSYENMMRSLDGDDITEGFWRYYDKIQDYFKSSLTTIFPSFHARNGISNVILNAMDMGVEAFNPKTNALAVQTISYDRKIKSLEKLMSGSDNVAAQKATQEYGEIMSRVMFEDSSGYKWTFASLRNAAQQHGIAFNPNITGSADVLYDRRAMEEMFGFVKPEGVDKLLKPIDKVFEATRKYAATPIEEHARMVNFMSNLRKTGDVTHAAMRTKQFLFDYSNLTDFEKKFMRRLIPFYSFTRFNLELQAKALMTSPGRVSAQITGIKGVGEILGGEELTPEEQKLLPPWMKNSIALKKTKQDGSTQIITGFGTPIEQPFQQFNQNSILGSLSPLVKYPLERLTGQNFFRGMPISEVTNADVFAQSYVPRPIKEFIGLHEYTGVTQDGRRYDVAVALRPERMHMITSLPAIPRVLSTLNAVTDQDTEAGLRALQGLTGVRTDDINFERMAEIQQEQMIKDLEKLLRDAGVRGQFTRGYTRTNTIQQTQ